MKKRKERENLGILNHFGPLWWEKMGKGVKQPKLGILNQFRQLWWEKCRMTKIGHSELFQTILVGKDRKKCGMAKIVNAKNEFTTERAQ